MLKKIIMLTVIVVMALAGAAQADLVAYYDFEGDTQDTSGNGNNGTNTGVTFGTDVATALAHSTNSGIFVRVSDTVGDWVDLGDLGIYDKAHSGGVTVSFWVKAASQTGWMFGEGSDSDGDTAYVMGSHSSVHKVVTFACERKISQGKISVL